MKFLIDVNLPRNFSYFKDNNFYHVVDLNPRMKDAEIWQYALENNLTILTKDTDFYHRITLTDKSPKVVLFKLGNQTLSQLHEYFSKYWPTILTYLENSRMIIAYPDQVKIIR